MKFSHGNGLPGELLDDVRAASGCCTRRPRAPSARARRASSASERLCQPPRRRWSSTGVRSPLSHGREDHAVAARRRGRGDVVEQRVEVVGRGRRPQRVAREEHVVAQPVEACARDLLLVGDVVLARQRRRQRRDAVEEVGLLERHVARQPRRRADVEVPLEVAHRARADRGRLEVGRAADDGDPGGYAEVVGDGVLRAARPPTSPAPGRGTGRDRRRTGAAARRRSRCARGRGCR